MPTLDPRFHLPWRPDPEGLWRWLNERATDEVLQRIAAADHDIPEQQAAHLKALVGIRDGASPPPTDWEPIEALFLMAISEPEEAEGDIAVFHLARAWSGVALIRTGAGADASSVLFVESLLHCGEEACVFALGLFSHMSRRVAHDPAQGRVASFLLASSLMLEACLLRQRAERLLELERLERDAMPRENKARGMEDRWLIGLDGSGSDFARQWAALSEAALSNEKGAIPALAEVAQLLQRR